VPGIEGEAQTGSNKEAGAQGCDLVEDVDRRGAVVSGREEVEHAVGSAGAAVSGCKRHIANLRESKWDASLRKKEDFLRGMSTDLHD